MIRTIIIVFLISVPLLLTAGAAVFWLVPNQPWGDEQKMPVEFIIRKGANVTGVSEELEALDLIKSSRYTTLRYKVAERLGMAAPLQTGRYMMEFGLRPSEILHRLTSAGGAWRAYKELVIPPGFTSRQIALRAENTGLTTKDEMLRAINELAAEYPVLKNPAGLQGYMFPDTYKVEIPLENTPEQAALTANSIVRQMTDRFFEILDDTDPGWKDLTRAQLHEKVTLASIVEREYRVAEEAPKIAAVFHNRIVNHIPLESCATVVYVISETEVGRPYYDNYIRYNRRIFEQYLEIPSDYNTYQINGLPPGPISSPGQTAINAAFFPANTDALFFVVNDPQAGTHTFSREYGDHLAAREVYLNQYVVKD